MSESDSKDCEGYLHPIFEIIGSPTTKPKHIKRLREVFPLIIGLRLSLDEAVEHLSYPDARAYALFRPTRYVPFLERLLNSSQLASLDSSYECILLYSFILKNRSKILEPIELSWLRSTVRIFCNKEFQQDVWFRRPIAELVKSLKNKKGQTPALLQFLSDYEHAKILYEWEKDQRKKNETAEAEMAQPKGKETYGAASILLSMPVSPLQTSSTTAEKTNHNPEPIVSIDSSTPAASISPTQSSLTMNVNLDSYSHNHSQNSTLSDLLPAYPLPKRRRLGISDLITDDLQQNQLPISETIGQHRNSIS
ncbi:MAG: hypothetical protein M1829_002987 [Trizodia sp. TS-e1964]|nr:MAG: hypothetical protein M1829_002987 [Trizodia sp. TS-e1964]